MEKKMPLSLLEWQRSFAAGVFEDPVAARTLAGWVEWECRWEQLAEKTRFLGSFLMALQHPLKVDMENECVRLYHARPEKYSLVFCLRDLDVSFQKITIEITPKGQCWKLFEAGYDQEGNVVDFRLILEDMGPEKILAWLQEPWDPGEFAGADNRA
jgi:hypothetical protein